MSDQPQPQGAPEQLLLEEQSARRETELANARLLLLVAGSKRLSRTTSAGETLETLARLVIPGLADWSYVIHRGWNGGRRLVASAHGDPNKERLLHQLDESMPDLGSPEGAARVLRTGQPAIYTDLSSQDLEPGGRGAAIAGTRDAEQLGLLRELGMQSVMCVPIAGRKGIDAVLTLVSGADPQRYGPDDLVLAEDLASRAAVSLESGRLLMEALQAVRARDDFLSVAAHELRTPLTSLLLQVQRVDRTIARDCKEVAPATRGLAAIQTQAQRLSKLIDVILDVVRVASNRLTLQFEELDLRGLVEGVVKDMGEDIRRAGCEVTVSVPKDVPVRWDRARIAQVLANLLGNAIKFGSSRPIELRVDASATNVRISVRDHGPGIAAEDQPRIFDPFERAVSSRHYGGLGLGLYISAQILRMHQGSVRVESEPGQGACFIVDLPRGIRPPAQASETTGGLSL